MLAFVFFISGQVLAQDQKKITGTVSDKAGKTPLPGVSVQVKGTEQGVTTDEEGKYSIQAPSGAVLEFSFVGYGTREVRVGADTKIDVLLAQSVDKLDEVVVVGYGERQRRNLTGAVVSVGSEQIAERQALNIFDALQGQTPGVEIAQRSGRPGAGSSVRIRGTATMEGGADPLYIVDGAQGVDINTINPNDIESIEILKDGASAAIYGSRSANGVVIVTTKRGREGPPQIKGSYLNSYSTLSHKIPQANAADRRLYEQKSGAMLDGASLQDTINPSFNADNDYQDLLTQTARRHQLDLSLGGAGDKLNYYGSLAYLDEGGIILNSWHKRITGRLNMDYYPGERFTYGSRIQFSYRDQNLIHEGNTLTDALRRPPTYAVHYPDGSLAPTINGRTNPLAWALLRKDEDDIYDANIYNYFKFKILDGLTFTADAAYQFTYQHAEVFEPELLHTNTASPAEPISYGGEQDWLTNYWIVQGYFNYDKTLGKVHKLTGVLGVSADRFSFRRSNIAGNDWVSEQIPTINAAQQLILNDIWTNGIRRTQASAFGRLGYSYMEKYIIESNFRLDGSSRFGKDNRWGFFPSVSGAWRFSDESFLDWSDGYLDDGKIRVSYGVTGNDRMGTSDWEGNYDALQRYVFGSSFYNGVSGVVPATLFGNPALGWETTKQFNVGLDLTLFDERLSLQADYYDKITDDLLYNATMPHETGFDNVRVNVGSIQNKGLELNLRGYPVRGQNFQWHTSVNFSRNRGTVRELAEGTELLVRGIWLVQEGEPLGNFYGWKQLGVYAYDESNAWTDDGRQLTPVFQDNGGFSHYTLNGERYNGDVNQLQTVGTASKGGDAIWQDVNGDRVIDDADRIILGNAQPEWTGGWINTLTYKGISLSFNFYMSYGGSLYNQSRWVMSTYLTTTETPDPYIIHNAWSQPGDVTDVPIPVNNGMENVRELNSRYIEDASFIRLRNVKLTWALPERFISPLGLSAAGIYVYGNNLLTWTNYSWFDPEISFDNPLQMGEDTGRYPRKREFGLGVNLNF